MCFYFTSVVAMGVVHFLSKWIWRLRRPHTNLCTVGGGSLLKGMEKTDKQTHKHTSMGNGRGRNQMIKRVIL